MTTTVAPMTVEQATDIYLILVDHAGADLDGLADFVRHQTSGGDFAPYPFTGQLGTGSVFTEYADGWRVSALHVELERRPSMRDVLDVTNAALATAYAVHTARRMETTR